MLKALIPSCTVTVYMLDEKDRKSKKVMGRPTIRWGDSISFKNSIRETGRLQIH